ncbi:hypothetical protein MA20_19375 [Bradyrhizobium japonicum]|uniref:Uncharacterized protein n=1 Tax=Bradyrhizobium japonicum TaxID=375 RepID=A0A0A3XYL9_BRAJP|nr:hypothetical protein MA20_19375 [Bradyrhizobium japonicum]
MMMQKRNGAARKVVMPGLVPGIHVLRSAWQGVDGRDKPGHDGMEALVPAICGCPAPMGRGGSLRP